MNDFIRLLIISSICFIGSINLNAQSNFIDGFYINKQGDTTYTKVRYYSGINSYRICETLSEDGNIITYLPKDVKGYGYKNDASFSSNVIDSVFLQNVIKGTISLYEKQNTYYISTKDTVYQIKNSSKLVDRNGKTYITNQDIWKGRLYYLAKNDVELKELIDQLYFRKKDLKKFVIQLNIKNQTNYTDLDIQNNLDKVNWGLRIGQQFNRLTKNSGGYYPDINDLYNSQSQTISLFATFNVPEFSKSLSFNTELLLSQIRYSGSRIDSNSSPVNEYETNFHYIQISTPIYLSYRLNQNSLFLSILAGANTQFNINDEYSTKRTTIIGQYEQESVEQPFIPYNFQPGILLGLSIGLELKEIEIGIDTRYIRFSKLNKELNLFVNQQHINAGFYIKF
ncbi:hypothetical protein MATR_20750 [Marivirga tractuosa]|uniref:Outer membrane protein beta-barrel domain-containing protein n=1 Tax=Marivirga tractuosa (strain ATCC 23168 / DSM 4126 / NBRC 15989 / NCIMB 1408 / VKM B-1430 / H-43) TaxID=643867 RepID=E4TM17_MARTH|nr:outer membrane beta-barrel protein [Marivirga tractuosa]ADR20308.1 hypothetical protein Ftrac_0299 [Marivirga tractuosa DSM 4126]BDD15250.1 hypothetical protein MATR_20750 [Marivirga tractuosa]